MKKLYVAPPLTPDHRPAASADAVEPFPQELTLNTEVVKDKSKAKRRKLERALQGQVKEKNLLPKDAFRVEHLNYKVSARSRSAFSPKKKGRACSTAS